MRRARALLLALALAGASAAAQAPGREPWPPRALEALDTLAVQDGGRVKPLSTFAAFTLLRFSGRRTLALADGTRLEALPWLLDVLVRPELAEADELFLIQDDAVATAIGLHLDKRRRDRWSFAELRPGLPRLFDMAHRLAPLDAKERSATQEQLVFLAESVDAFLGLTHALDHARAGLSLAGSERLRALFGGREAISFADLLERAGAADALAAELRAAGDGAQADAVLRVLRGAQELAAAGAGLALFAPAQGALAEPAWLSAADLLAHARSGRLAPQHLAALRALEGVARGPGAAGLAEAAGGLAQGLGGLAQERGEYARIGLERAYYRWRPLAHGLTAFVAAFLAVACSWLFPRRRFLARAAWLGCVAGAALVVAAIVVRCVIRGRPPVSTLYETVLFVTAVGAVLALVVERIDRQRVALSAAAALGMVGLFLANGFETLDKRDTMPSLVAVLDTNFWLATHVTAITIGYSAGMLAALLASVYLVARLLGLRGGERAFYARVSRMVYGVVCFALIFSLVGTVLGGIWANESWGRFWGWDPKENGALLIVISQVALLHARQSGILREHGVCMAAAFGGTVIAFSWWGVNLLGVGLHSYGFTSGIQRALWTYYGLQWAVVGAGGVAWLRARRRTGALRAVPAQAAQAAQRRAA